MGYPRCPHLDILSNRLIEAYRDLAFGETSAVEGKAVTLNSSIVALQSSIQEHRKSCILCQKIASAPSASKGKVA